MHKRRTTTVGASPVKLLLSVDEAAEALSVGRTLLYDLLMSGQIASIKVGAARRVPVAALQEFIKHLSGQEIF